MPRQTQRIWCFGPWILNCAEATLYRDGQPVALQPRPAAVLEYLISNRERTVSREDLRREVWGSFVDDNSIDRQISDLRKILGGERNSIIETRYKRGWSFILPVTESAETESGQAVPSPEPAASEPEHETRDLRPHPLTWTIALVLLFALAIYLSSPWNSGPGRGRRIEVLAYRQLTRDPTKKLGPLFFKDGRLYFRTIHQLSEEFVSVSADGGEVQPIGLPPRSFPLDVLPGGKFVLSEEDDAGQVWAFIWSRDGSKTYINEGQVAAAAVSPDGKRIALGSSGTLLIHDLSGDARRKTMTSPGLIGHLRWNPGSTSIRAMVVSPLDNTSSLWDFPERSNLAPVNVFPNWTETKSLCCGSWASRGGVFAFAAFDDTRSDIWLKNEEVAQQAPVRLTNSPLRLSWPAMGDASNTIYAIGGVARPELVKTKVTSGAYVPFLDGLPATEVDYSRDQSQLSYVLLPERTLWVRSIDGQRSRQLGRLPLRASQPHWSPDGRRIAFMGENPGEPSRVYVADVSSGAISQAAPSGPDQGVPSWSSDGLSIVYGELQERRHASEMELHLIELEGAKTSVLPGSKGKWTARWSPDGRYIAALGTDFRTLFVFDLATKRWIQVVRSRNLGDPVWTIDGKYIFLLNASKSSQYESVLKVKAGEWNVEEILRLDPLMPLFNLWFGLTPDGSLLFTRSVHDYQLYAIDWAYR